jgi:hypothetical protein
MNESGATGRFSPVFPLLDPKAAVPATPREDIPRFRNAPSLAFDLEKTAASGTGQGREFLERNQSVRSSPSSGMNCCDREKWRSGPKND